MDMQSHLGLGFHPTGEELVIHYLGQKCTSQQIPSLIIAETDFYKHDPWHIPCLALYVEKDWYIFWHREPKYPNGSRPNQSSDSEYWKATGVDNQISRPKPVEIKKALVILFGKDPCGQKTNWIMHEYSLIDVDRSTSKNITNRKMS